MSESTVRFSVLVLEFATRQPIAIRCDSLEIALLVMARYANRDPRLVGEVPAKTRRGGEKA